MEKKKNQTNNPAIEELFQKLDPFFDGFLVSMNTFSLTRMSIYRQAFTDFLPKAGSNFYENFIENLIERIKEGFQSSMTKMKDIPFDENFFKIIKEDMDSWECAKKNYFGFIQTS